MRSIVKITRGEADYLRKHGRGHDVHMTSRGHKGHSKHYFATTNKKTLDLLDEYKVNVGLKG